MISNVQSHRWLTVAVLAAIGAFVGGCRVPHSVSDVPGLRPSGAITRPEVTWIDHVCVLADPVRGGRMTCTPGNAHARQYIIRQFADIGLTPGGKGGRWLDPFAAPTLRTPGAGSVLTIQPGSRPVDRAEYSPMAAGAAGPFQGQVVFVGHGYRNALLGRDDYAGQNVRGKVVLILRGSPLGTRPGSLWQTKGPAARALLVVSKLKTAARMGAVAALFVTPPDACTYDPLASVIGTGSGPLPAMRISRTLAQTLLARGGAGKMLSHPPAAPVTLDVRVRGRCELDAALAHNVIGVLPGRGMNGPVVIVGAHYDHLPASGHKAKDSGIGVRPGADDNASGVATLIETARALSAVRNRSCTFMFVAFDHEEFGFLGSKHFVDHLPVPPERIAVMVNFDQLGAMKGHRVAIIGNVLRQPFRNAIKVAASRHPGLRVRPVPLVNKRSWSDQAAFARKGIATLFLFTRFSKRYHRKTDTSDTVNAEGGVQITSLAVDLLKVADQACAP